MTFQTSAKQLTNYFQQMTKSKLQPRRISKNFAHLVKSYNKGFAGAALEGGSRSNKTWGGLDFLVWYAKRNIGKQISIIRQTYNSFKNTLFLDFNRRFPDFGIKSPTAYVKECQTFSLLGNRVNLIGADGASKSEDKAHGAGSDIAWFNEPMFISQDFFDQTDMRCREFVWFDYNPVATKHWIYDSYVKRDDIAFLKTTMLDNPWISPKERMKILSYNPFHPEDSHLPEEERRPHPTNIEQGTADLYKWHVYGEGKRSQQEGCIITNWKREPFDLSLPFLWAMDFGFTTDPTTLVKLAVDGSKLYARGYLYEPEMTTGDIIKFLEKTIKNKDDIIIADNAEPRMIRELQEAGFNVFPCVKGPDSVRKGIDNLKEMQLIVDINEESDQIENEINNYVWLKDKSNVPIDKYNHYIDPIRYGNDELKNTGGFYVS